MENEKLPTGFILRNWGVFTAFCAILFALGGIYQENRENAREIQSLKEWKEIHLKEAEHDHQLIQEKQDRKWGDIPEIEQRVDDLEEWKAFLEGHEKLPVR